MTEEFLPDAAAVQDDLWILLVLLVFWATVGRWLYRDAKSRGSEWAWQWGFGTPLTVVAGVDVMLVVVVIYRLNRASASGLDPEGEARRRIENPTVRVFDTVRNPQRQIKDLNPTLTETI